MKIASTTTWPSNKDRAGHARHDAYQIVVEKSVVDVEQKYDSGRFGHLAASINSSRVNRRNPPRLIVQADDGLNAFKSDRS
jgi:hypothetical protein